jgi:hypothetical protein
VSQSSLDGFTLSPEARTPGKTFVVLRQPADERGLDQKIAASLRARGLDVAAGDVKDASYTVSYVDRWQWDMRMYLIDLRIDVRDARTNVLVATARSYQTSLAAMGKTHESIIDQTADVLIQGIVQKPKPVKRGNPTRR